MSNPRRKHAGIPATRFPAAIIAWVLAGILLAGAGPPSSAAADADNGLRNAPPRLVRARRDDTAATLARRHLGDAAKGWIIAEYNDSDAFADGQAVLIPAAPFRLGGLTPDGFQTLPVLAYTAIGDSGGKAAVSVAAFEAQMEWLRQEGFTAITPAELSGFLYFNGQLPRRAVMITADTEAAAFLRLAVPVLKQAGFNATLFVATDAVGGEGALGWDQLQSLSREGFTIGCRGGSGHPLIRPRGPGSARERFTAMHEELQQAKALLESRLGSPCTLLAYPQGKSDRLLAATAARLGFVAAFTRSPGDNPFFVDRLAIHRITINGGTTLEQFARRMVTRIKADLH